MRPVMASIAQQPQRTLSLGEQLERLRLQHRSARLRAALARVQLLTSRAQERGEPVAPTLQVAGRGFRGDLDRIEARLRTLGS